MGINKPLPFLRALSVRLESHFCVLGKDNYAANLTDFSFGAITKHYTENRILNVGYYSRFYSLDTTDAMGTFTSFLLTSDLPEVAGCLPPRLVFLVLTCAV